MDLLELAKNGDEASKQELVIKNSGLVWSIVKRFYGRGHEPEDLFQIGCIGLLKAIYKFKPELNNCFSTYAVPMIIGEIRKFIRDDGCIKVSRSLKELSVKIGYAKNSLVKSLCREPSIYEIAVFLDTSIENITMAIEVLAPVESISKEDCMQDILKSNESFESEILDKIIYHQAISNLDDQERQLLVLRCQRQMTQSQVAKIMQKTQVQISRLEKKIFSKLQDIRGSN